MDVLEEVNAKIPHTASYNPYITNPLSPAPIRVWRKHKQLFHEDTGARHRVKCYAIASLVSAATFATIVLIWVFVVG